MAYLVARLSYEYKVPFQSIIDLPELAFQAHVAVLEDIAKAVKDANRNSRKYRP